MESVLEQLQAALKDRYRVDAEVGRGGMATVYRAQDLKYDRPVAIKVLSPDIASVISAERFEREIRISAKLSHPNILTVLDSGEVGELLYYVMTFVEGESLRGRLRRETYLPMEDAIQITCEVADALAYAHAQGVIHRDIKPENILLRDGHVLVADFGIARATTAAEGETLTAVGMSLGTAAYMSPEQAAGDPVDPRSDIYSLGCTIYEMLAGQLPYTGPNAMAIAARRMVEPVPPIRIVRPAVPDQLEAVVVRSMERVAADRFQTMGEFKRALLGETPTGTMSFTASRYTPLYMTAARMTPERNRRRRLAIGGGIAALLLILAAAGARYFLKGGPPPAAPDANRVAVMYFDDASNGSLRYLADGLTESLIDRLSTVSALDVISKDGVRAFRGHDVASDSVGRVLQVGSIVRGSVEREGGKVGLTVRLVDAASNVDLARKRFDVDTSRIVASEADIATNVVDFLRERLGNEVRLRAERAATTSSQAWTMVERAGKLRKDADSLAAGGAGDAALAALARADTMLASAEQLDRQWAKIPVLRADVMYATADELARLNKEPARVAEALDRGLEHADQALRLEPNNPDAFEIKGELQYLRYSRRVDSDPRKIERLLPAAESSLTKAVELNKDQAGAWAALSRLYYAKPDIQAANSAALNAYNADAYLSSAKLILTRLFWTSHDLEQFPEALKWCNVAHRRFPSDPFFVECRLWMYTTRLEKPDVDSAWLYRKNYVSLSPAERRVYAEKMGDILVGGALARAGLPDSARRVLLRARATPQEDPSRELEGNEAVIRVILGDQDEAVRLIADYLTVNPGHRKGFAVRTGPWWRDLQSNPKFRALIAGAR